MSERVIICRHAHSPANERGGEAFGQSSAGLSYDRGIPSARRFGWELENHHGVHPPSTPVAVSCMMRTQETAYHAGFTEVYRYATLDEVPHGCESFEAWRELKQDRVLQQAALVACVRQLERYFNMDDSEAADVPAEEVWISHGYRMAHFLAAAADLGLRMRREGDTFIPAHCEIIELSQ